VARLTPYAEKIIGDYQCGFYATGKLLIIYSAFIKYLRKKWEYNEAMQQLFTDFQKAYDSVRWEVFYNILIAFGMPMKLGGLIKMCLN
jgi:hypothetical protein